MNTKTIASPRRIDDILVRLDNEHGASANEILHISLKSTGLLTWDPRDKLYIMAVTCLEQT